MSEHDITGTPGKERKKLQIWMDPAEIDAIDGWQFRNRFPTRAAAIRELIRRGMEAAEDPGDPA